MVLLLAKFPKSVGFLFTLKLSFKFSAEQVNRALPPQRKAWTETGMVHGWSLFWCILLARFRMLISSQDTTKTALMPQPATTGPSMSLELTTYYVRVRACHRDWTMGPLNFSNGKWWSKWTLFHSSTLDNSIFGHIQCGIFVVYARRDLMAG